MPQKKEPEPKKTYTWVLDPEGMLCFRADESFCTVTNFWETTQLTDFHDAELAQATKEIKAILRNVEKSNKDSGRKLSFIRFQNRHFLVWARHGAVGQRDEGKTIIKALNLRVK